MRRMLWSFLFICGFLGCGGNVESPGQSLKAEGPEAPVPLQPEFSGYMLNEVPGIGTSMKDFLDTHSSSKYLGRGGGRGSYHSIG
jgi:hypothetical protein